MFVAARQQIKLTLPANDSPRIIMSAGLGDVIEDWVQCSNRPGLHVCMAFIHLVNCQIRMTHDLFLLQNSANYESWVVPAGVPSALADIGGRVEANY